MKRSHVVLFLAGLSLFLSASAQADVLASYSFSTNRDSEDSHALTTAGTFGFGSAGTNWAYSSQQKNVYGRANTTAADEASALIGSYFTFTLTLGGLGEGEVLNLTSLTFDTLANAGGGVTGSATASFFVRSSLDEFATNIGGTFTQGYINGTSMNPEARVVDLSGYQGVVASSIEFRVYVFDDSADSNRTPRLDNVVLNGEVAPLVIPEPAAAGALVAAGALGFAVVSRRGGRRTNGRI